MNTATLVAIAVVIVAVIYLIGRALLRIVGGLADTSPSAPDQELHWDPTGYYESNRSSDTVEEHDKLD
jgi:hypothetical protein